MVDPGTQITVSIGEPRSDTINLNPSMGRSSVQQLTDMVKSLLDITEKQKDKLEEFLNQREKIGDLVNDDLSVEGELGSGNGGVVLKVRHKKTQTVMAKKVIKLQIEKKLLLKLSF